MSAQLFYSPQNVLFTSRGLPAGAASVYFFYTGTTSKAPIYSDAGLTTPLTNPVPADGLGKLPNIYMDSTTIYRVRAVDSNGVPMGLDTDPYIPGATGDAAASAAAASAVAAKTSETNAAASAADAEDSASASANSATAAALVAIAAGTYPNAAATNVPRGLTQASVGAITAGSGGTNGTFAVAWSGGNFAANPTATFTVAGGVLTAFTITGPGRYIGASPTVPTPSFAASSGLTGAAVALTAQFLISSGMGYWVVSSDGSELLHYQNVSGTATVDSGISFPLTPSLTSLIADVSDLTAFVSTLTETEQLGTTAVGGDVLVTSSGTGLTVYGDAVAHPRYLMQITRDTNSIGSGIHKLVVLRNTGGSTNQAVEVHDLPSVTSTGVTAYTTSDFGSVFLDTGDRYGFAMPVGGPDIHLDASDTTGVSNGFITDYFDTVGDSGSFTGTGGTGLRAIHIEAVLGTQALGIGYDALSAALQAMIDGGAQAAPIDLPSGSLPVATKRVGAIAWGQSNSNGTKAIAPLSTTQPYSNLGFTRGPRSVGPTYAAIAPTQTVGTTGEVALIENTLGGADKQPDGDDGESTCAGSANDATTLRLTNLGGAASDLIWFSSAPGFSGEEIANLRKGQARYANLNDHMNAQVARAVAAGHTFAFLDMTFIQGEQDAISNDYATYLASLLGHFAEVRADMKTKSGQAWNPHTLIFQTPYRTLSDVSNPSAHPGDIQRAQFDVVNQDTLCHYVAPLYLFPTGADTTHCTNISNRRMAFYRGRAQYQLLHEQRVPDCLWPLAATAIGTRVTLKLRVPNGPLVFDTATMFAATDYGQKLVDDTGTLTLTDWLIDGDEISVTVHRALGTNPRWRSALDYVGTGQAGIGYACANIRDSTPGKVTVSGTDYPVWHAIPQCQIPIVVVEANL